MANHASIERGRLSASGAMMRSPTGMRRRAGMRRRHRMGIYTMVGSLWLTGCVWIVLEQFFPRNGPFGPTPHPWQPPTLLVHGVLAILTLYLFGWVGARHILHWWPSGARRWSGTLLAMLLMILVVSGFALFFLSDDLWQHRIAVLHDWVGLGITPLIVQHWFFFVRGRQIRAAAECASSRC